MSIDLSAFFQKNSKNIQKSKIRTDYTISNRAKYSLFYSAVIITVDVIEIDAATTNTNNI